MSITNPFFQNNNLNNNNPEQKSQKLPPKINNQNLPPSKDQILNKKNQQYHQYFPKIIKLYPNLKSLCQYQ